MIAQLHEVLDLTRPLVAPDLETTGVDARTAEIVEIGLEIFTPGEPVKEWRSYVKPKRPIPTDATRIHGITDAMVADAPSFAVLAPSLLQTLTGCDLAGYNVRFDCRILAESFKRYSLTWDYESARILDGYRLWQVLEGRTLGDAADRWLDVHDVAALKAAGTAHSALWDTKTATRVIASQIEKRALTRDLDALHTLQWPGWFDVEGKLRWLPSGKLSLTFGEHRDKPLDRVPEKYLAWILRSDFSDKVKATCRDAIEGRFATRTVDTDPDD